MAGASQAPSPYLSGGEVMKYQVSGDILRRVSLSAIVEATSEEEAIEMVLAGEGEEFDERDQSIDEVNLDAEEVTK